SLRSVRPLPALRRCTFRPALRAAIRAPLVTSPACAPHSNLTVLSSPAASHSCTLSILCEGPLLKSPNLPKPCRLHPCKPRSSTDPACARGSSLPDNPGCRERPRRPWFALILAAQSAAVAFPAHPVPPFARNSW